MPTLLIAGAEDCFYVSEKTAIRLQKLLPHFKANVLPETGHVLLNTTPQVMSFLTAAECA
jgi:pimeloyl-ACP methyl ester carboxylesterase